ncbi:MAG: hypothetical protein QXL15_02120 [Candidatus Korarchaeota archaeon]
MIGSNDSYVRAYSVTNSGMKTSWYHIKGNMHQDGVVDKDGDWLGYQEEKKAGTNPNNPDVDNDGLPDGMEIKVFHTNPKKSDSDDDGLGDMSEIFTHHTNPNSADSDNDGMPDGWEVQYTLNPLINDANEDPDGDGLNNLSEYQIDTNPKKADTDNDGLKDGEEKNTYLTDPKKADTDMDGLNDGDEIKVYGTNPLKDDSDGDGLKDGDEVSLYRTNPSNNDTDGDGLNDGDEIKVYGTNPLKDDSDGDGLKDGDEVFRYGTNPTLLDTDGDGMDDGSEVALGRNPLVPEVSSTIESFSNTLIVGVIIAGVIIGAFLFFYLKKKPQGYEYIELSETDRKRLAELREQEKSLSYGTPTIPELKTQEQKIREQEEPGIQLEYPSEEREEEKEEDYYLDDINM